MTIARGDRDGLGLAFHLRSREAEKSDCCRTLSQNITQYPPGNLPSIRLTHGQAIWVLTMLGYGDGVSPKTFYEYIKSLRKLGIPFGRQNSQIAKEDAGLLWLFRTNGIGGHALFARVSRST